MVFARTGGVGLGGGGWVVAQFTRYGTFLFVEHSLTHPLYGEWHITPLIC